MNTGKPRRTSIRVFLADTTPAGLRVVEKSNWTGRAVVANNPNRGWVFCHPQEQISRVGACT